MALNWERKRILIADDSEMNRDILADILGEEYEIIEAEDGQAALDMLTHRSGEIDMLLLDYVMPKLNGFQVLEAMKSSRMIESIPVIMISAENSMTYVEQAYDLGVVDFISRPFEALVVQRRVANTMLLYVKQKKLRNMVLQQIYEKERQSSLMIDILSHIVEFRNGESGRHVLNIHVLTRLVLSHLVKITDKYALTPEDIALITTASALHDIGKIDLPTEVLNKPGRFTKEEYDIMKRHSEIGDEMLGQLTAYQDEPLVKMARQICRWHHERYDGKGYPDGLQGEEIPISAQVVALADVYDALTAERVYKKPFSHEVAVEMILNGECGTFNPLLMECLRAIAPTLQKELDEATDEGLSDYQLRSAAEEIMNRENL